MSYQNFKNYQVVLKTDSILSTVVEILAKDLPEQGDLIEYFIHDSVGGETYLSGYVDYVLES